jgi:hypothetical protein
VKRDDVRKALGVAIGGIVAFTCVQAAEMITHHFYPFPPGADMKDMATIKRFVATLPVQAFVLVLGGWLVGTLVGTFLAAKIGRDRLPAYIVGAFLLAAGIANSILIPQPVWFTAASIVIFLAVPFAGMAMAKPVQSAPA